MSTDTVPNEKLWSFVKPLVFKTIIGAIVAAALVGVVAVILGEFGTLSLQLLATIGIIIVFTLLAWYDADVSSKRSHTFALIGVGISLYLLIAGFVKVWIISTPEVIPYDYNSLSELTAPYWSATEEIVIGLGQWILLAFIARFALLHAHLLLNLHRRYATTLLQVVAKLTMVLIAIFALLLSLPQLFDNVDYMEGYWRLVAAVLILDLLGTILIPISHALFKPRHPQYGQQPQQFEQQSNFGPIQQNFVPPVSNTFQPPLAYSSPEQIPTESQTVVHQQGQVIFDSPVTGDRRLAWPRFVDGTPVPANDDGSPNFDNVARY